MLAGLNHRTICGTNDQNRAIHLRGTRDHVFHIVGMPGAIYMGIVPIFRLILHMSRINGNTALFFFGCFVNVVKGHKIGKPLGCQRLGNSSSQRGFAVINMPDCANVDMGFVPFKFFLRHIFLLKRSNKNKKRVRLSCKYTD